MEGRGEEGGEREREREREVIQKATNIHCHLTTHLQEKASPNDGS